jgi:hypothetical protein
MDQWNSERKASYSPQQLKMWRQKARANLLRITAVWIGHVLEKHTHSEGTSDILLEPGNAYLTEPLSPEERDTLSNFPNWICPICATLEQRAQNVEAHLKEIERIEVQSWVTFSLD